MYAADAHRDAAFFPGSRRRQDFGDSGRFAFDRGNDQNLIVLAGCVARESFDLHANFADLAAELFNRLNRQLPLLTDRSGGDGARRSQPSPRHFLTAFIPREKFDRFRSAFCEPFGFFFECVWLDQQDRGVFRYVIEKVAVENLAVLIRQHGDLKLLQARYAPLGRGVELAERFDLVIEQFNTNRAREVRRKHVQNSATVGELAWQVDRTCVVESVFEQPRLERFHIQLISNFQPPRISTKRLRRRNRLQ